MRSLPLHSFPSPHFAGKLIKRGKDEGTTRAAHLCECILGGDSPAHGSPPPAETAPGHFSLLNARPVCSRPHRHQEDAHVMLFGDK
jgi:hypothetical protein